MNGTAPVEKSPGYQSPNHSPATKRSRRSQSGSSSNDTYDDLYDSKLDSAESGRSRSRSRSKTPSHHSQRSKSRSPERPQSVRSHHSSRKSRSRSRSRSASVDLSHNTELKSSWSVVKANPGDFDAWTVLLQKVEQINDVGAAREVFSRFLARYPYCYGYWRKYADFERKNGNIEKALEVWERSVSAIPLCVDLWLPFLTFFKELALMAEGGVDKIRELMERALLSAGLEYNSDRLWNEVIQFEEDQKCPRRIMDIFERLIRIPTSLHMQHFERFQMFVNSYEPQEILSDEEYRELFNKCRKNLDVGVDQLTYEERIPLNPGIQIAPGEDTFVLRKRHCAEILKPMRDEIINRRRAVQLETAGLVMKRAPFEEKIKRPYFHVKPLDPLEFENWRQYIDMEIDTGKDTRVIVLFERCLIATAMYDEFWMKYARWRWRTKGDVEGARAVYRRACDVHCRNKPLVHLAFSAFEETLGNVDTAMEILENFNRRVPGLAMIKIRMRNLERRTAVRLAQLENGEPDFAKVIYEYEALIKSDATPLKLSGYYAIRLAQFHSRIRDDPSSALKVIKSALKADPTNYSLMLQLVDVAMDIRPLDEKKVIEAFDFCLGGDLASSEKLEISQRKLEFLEEFASDVTIIQEHLDYHHALVHKHDLRLAKKRLQLVESSLFDRNSHSSDSRYRARTTQYAGGVHYMRRSSGSHRGSGSRGDRDRERERGKERDRERDSRYSSSGHRSSSRHH